jgi:plasmid stability protein
MPQVLVRDIETDVLEKLKRRAQKNHRSLEAELRVVFEQAVAEPEAGNVEAAMARVQEMFAGRRFSDSAELLREDRDR